MKYGTWIVFHHTLAKRVIFRFLFVYWSRQTPVSRDSEADRKLAQIETDGLAFLTNNGAGTPLQGTGVYLISGAFVTSPAAQGRRAAK
ncbi:MAG TPA: hypothetical protein VFN53_02015 [Acidobacteriaceae bacterium]|nr:hypothetical protein [Acidobacteriaceae bacterium]